MALTGEQNHAADTLSQSIDRSISTDATWSFFAVALAPCYSQRIERSRYRRENSNCDFDVHLRTSSTRVGFTEWHYRRAHFLSRCCLLLRYSLLLLLAAHSYRSDRSLVSLVVVGVDRLRAGQERVGPIAFMDKCTEIRTVSRARARYRG